jgi:hypothetical protein
MFALENIQRITLKIFAGTLVALHAKWSLQLSNLNTN